MTAMPSRCLKLAHTTKSRRIFHQHGARFKIQQNIEPWRNHKDASRQQAGKSLWSHQNHMFLDPCETATESRGKIGHQLDTKTHTTRGKSFVPSGE
jgi:hypothetical protein